MQPALQRKRTVGMPETFATVMLCEAAQVMLTRTNKWSWLKAWAMRAAG
jgi:hypothetical protein